MAPTTRSEKAKAFTTEGEKTGLKQETMVKLCGEDIISTDILRLCSIADVNDLQLSKGQSLVLLQWIAFLNVEDAASVAALSQTSQPADGNLDILLGDMEEAPAATGGTIDPPSTGKPLLVVDHINCVVGGISDVPEHQVYSQGDTQPLLRSSRAKPSPDRVTLAQWVGANARILQQLIHKGTIQSLDEVSEYLEYNIIF